MRQFAARGRWLLAAVPLTFSSCVLVRVPVETAGTVVGSGARVAEKTAVTTVEVAGEAAEAAIDGRLPGSERSVWAVLR